MQTITFRMDKNEVLLYSTGNFIQSLVIEHDGIWEKVYIYICICVYIFIYIFINKHWVMYMTGSTLLYSRN